MPRFILYTPYSNAAVNAGTTQGQTQPNTARSDNPTITIVVTVANVPTGTSPTLAFSLMTSVDSLNFALHSTTTPVITTAGTYRFTFLTVFEPILRLDTVVGGSATPQFTGVTVSLLTSGAEEA